MELAYDLLFNFSASVIRDKHDASTQHSLLRFVRKAEDHARPQHKANMMNRRKTHLLPGANDDAIIRL